MVGLVDDAFGDHPGVAGDEAGGRGQGEGHLPVIDHRVGYRLAPTRYEVASPRAVTTSQPPGSTSDATFAMQRRHSAMSSVIESGQKQHTTSG